MTDNTELYRQNTYNLSRYSQQDSYIVWKMAILLYIIIIIKKNM